MIETEIIDNEKKITSGILKGYTIEHLENGTIVFKSPAIGKEERHFNFLIANIKYNDLTEEDLVEMCTNSLANCIMSSANEQSKTQLLRRHKRIIENFPKAIFTNQSYLNKALAKLDAKSQDFALILNDKNAGKNFLKKVKTARNHFTNYLIGFKSVHKEKFYETDSERVF